MKARRTVDVSVMLGPRSLGLTLKVPGGAMLYADLPRPDGAELMSEDELLKIARAQTRRLFKAAAEDLA